MLETASAQFVIPYPLRACAAALLVLAAPAAWAACPSFATATPYAATSPQAVAVGDFNRDGIPDIAITQSTAGNVAIRFGGTGGLFGPVDSTNTTGTNPQSITVADFNHDGIIDLAVANYDSNDVSVLLGNGNGTFQAAKNYTTGTHPITFVTGDFNRDGIIDLATANYGDGKVSILLGTLLTGAGAFQAKNDYLAGSTPHGLVVEDFNRDGKLDLAVPNFSANTVSILLGDGLGAFGSPSPFGAGFGAGSFPYSIASKDLDGDGTGWTAPASTARATRSSTCRRDSRPAVTRSLPTTASSRTTSASSPARR